MRDLMNNIHLAGANVAAPTDNTPIVSGIVDRRGFDSVTGEIRTGTLVTAAATYTVLLQHGDAADLSDAAAVADADLLGTEALAGFTGTDDNKSFKLGYRGTKRYVRLTVTPAGNLGAAPIGVGFILGHPAQAPTANPPA